MKNCRFTHGWKEYDYHVQIYKTRACRQGKKCLFKQTDCPFYHGKEDLRSKNIV